MGVAHAMGQSPRRFTRHPFRMARSCRYLAVQRHGAFGRHPRQAGGNVFDKDFIEALRLRFKHPRIHTDARRAQAFDAAARHVGVRIAHGYNHAARPPV
ncbi:MAG: hypothetical protein BWX80_03830 [Candidatus Hydrogenedentes bacterium ADurb.Bin101]|nr:MAG: hypothetical protein BWX80_03830 [Candidatus Hydrogenedentes bacterium ADurb.Bin101]